MSAERKEGKVIIAGAGPGDAELITLKLQKRLREADVIITDNDMPEIDGADLRGGRPQGIRPLPRCPQVRLAAQANITQRGREGSWQRVGY